MQLIRGLTHRMRVNAEVTEWFRTSLSTSLSDETEYRKPVHIRTSVYNLFEKLFRRSIAGRAQKSFFFCQIQHAAPSRRMRNSEVRQ